MYLVGVYLSGIKSYPYKNLGIYRTLRKYVANMKRLLLVVLEFKVIVGLLTKPKSLKGQFSDQKYLRRTMESKLEGTVNYLQFVDCTFDAAKRNEES